MDRQWRSYRVIASRVVDSSRESLDTRSLAEDTLLLITCYPFDSLDASGPLRYVVEAKRDYALEQVDTVAVLPF